MITKKLTNWYDSDASYIEIDRHWEEAFPEILERLVDAVNSYFDEDDPFGLPNLQDILIEDEALVFISKLMHAFDMQGRISSSKQVLAVGDYAVQLSDSDNTPIMVKGFGY